MTETFDDFLKENKEDNHKFSWNNSDLEFSEDENLEEKVGDNYRNPKEAGKELIAKHRPSAEGHKSSEKYHRSLDYHSKKAIEQYTSSGYAKINRALRSGKNHPVTEHLDKVTSHKLSEDHHVYRTFGGKLHVGRLKTGAKVKDHGYTSTSHDYNVTNFFRNHKKDKTAVTHTDKEGVTHTHIFTAKIHLPKGTKAHYVDNKASNEGAGEHEVVVHRGTTYRVTGHSVHTQDVGKKWKEHHHIVHMTVHKQK